MMPVRTTNPMAYAPGAYPTNSQQIAVMPPQQYMQPGKKGGLPMPIQTMGQPVPTTIKADPSEMIQHTGIGTPVPFDIEAANNPPAPMPVAPPGANVPPTGLIGAEQAIQGGVDQSAGYLTSAMDATTTPDVYSQGGAGAAKIQADLTGANGPEAQAAAQAQLQGSPAMQFQMEEMQRAVERSAAAEGGLLSGNVLKELQRNAAGIASQDYQNQFANLGTVADRGFARTSAQDQMKIGLSRDLADTAMSAGVSTAGLRMDAGRSLAQNATQASSSISQLLNQRGIVVSDMMAKDISSVTDLIWQSGMQDQLSTQNLSAILANIAGGQGSTVTVGNTEIGRANAAGTIGAGNAVQTGIAEGVANWPTGQPSQRQTNNSAGYDWQGNQDPFS